MTKKWTIKPGEKYHKVHTNIKNEDLEQIISDISTEYLKDKDDKKVLVMAEDKSAIYFLVFSDEGAEELEYSDTYLFSPVTDKFELLPREYSTPITHAYVEHLTGLANAYRYLRGEQ